MSKNVLIPLSLLDQISEVLRYWDVSQYDLSVQFQYFNVLHAIDMKKHKLELRDDYAKIIYAATQDDRDEARIRYLQKKNWIRDEEAGIPF